MTVFIAGPVALTSAVAHPAVRRGNAVFTYVRHKGFCNIFLEFPMPDPFSSDYVNLTSPAVAHYVITPSDSADLPVRPRAIFVQTAGTAALQDKGVRS